MAVQGVSFGIKENECFGLLGPNGAGKTTVISMLSGSSSITAGDGLVGGFSAKKEMTKIRGILGICPQFDIIWPDLTVQEHLLLFARIKGLPKNMQLFYTRQVAEVVQLDGDSYRKKADQLSGGQRRRLSLGIALVASPKVILLDEPSTGLDPETRQGLWRIIAAISTGGRSVVLTTHSMEEADALCGRIAIMATGRLRCIGTPVHLKNKFGQGYYLSFSMQKDGDVSGLDAFVTEKFSQNAVVVPSWKGAHLRTYNLPKVDVKIQKIFKALTDDVKSNFKINEWSLNQTSLNEVFLHIAKESEKA
jgi:ABC-type multidrug transport system ATPase subunit